jgi:uncharacterized protein YcfJ
MNASKTLGAIGLALIGSAVGSAYAGSGDRNDGSERWSRSGYEYRYGDRERYYEHRVRRAPVVIERRVTVVRPAYTERHVVVRRPPVREVIVERPVYVERAPVYHDPYPHAYPPARATVSPGAVGGAIVGAIIGSQVGHGHNRPATTAAGAVIGGVIGSHW